MNRALDVKNWTEGGNNYVLKATAENKWSGFQDSVIRELSEKFGANFNLVIWTNEEDDNDYYCIPFEVVKDVFIDKHKTTGKYPNRWTAVILEHKFLMHSNSQLSIDISEFYAKPLIQKPLIELDEDFFIENAKTEINIRLGQSKFRKGVLKNFKNQCALTGISEIALLTASHIIPWSHKKEFRGDISNGISLYIEYDMLFDKGFISFTDNLEIIITPEISKFSIKLADKLNELEGCRLSQPKIREINREYLDYHRQNIFKK